MFRKICLPRQFFCCILTLKECYEYVLWFRHFRTVPVLYIFRVNHFITVFSLILLLQKVIFSLEHSAWSITPERYVLWVHHLSISVNYRMCKSTAFWVHLQLHIVQVLYKYCTTFFFKGTVFVYCISLVYNMYEFLLFIFALLSPLMSSIAWYLKMDRTDSNNRCGNVSLLETRGVQGALKRPPYHQVFTSVASIAVNGPQLLTLFRSWKP